MVKPVADSNESPQVQRSSVDHAWRALGASMDLVRHVEGKTGLTLAAAAATAGVLFNLMKSQNSVSPYLVASALACGIAIISTGVCCAIALWPRVDIQGGFISQLFFGHMSRWSTAEHKAYITQVGGLLADDESLTCELIGQMWSNACIARKKYRWSKIALSSFLIAILALALTAISILFS